VSLTDLDRGGNPYHDERGKFSHGPGGDAPDEGDEAPETIVEGGEGVEFDQATADEIRSVSSELTGRYKPALRKVYIQDVGSGATHGNDTIIFNSQFADAAYRQKRETDFEGLLAGGGTLRGTMVHEYGHILSGEMLRSDRAAFDEVEAYLDEEIPHMGQNIPRLLAGGNGPSPYGFENRREYVAEAFTDWYMNGDQAHPFSQHIGQIMDRSMAK
jgi:hypothetical protein